MFGWGFDCSRAERNLTIEQGPKIWGNFAKIGIKINIQICKVIGKIREKCKFAEIFEKLPGRE